MGDSDDEDTPQSAADEAVALARRGGAGLIIDFTTQTAARIAGGRFRRADRIAPGAAAEDDVSTRQRQFENEVERSVCEQRVREPNVGRFFGTVLSLRNSDRGLIWLSDMAIGPQQMEIIVSYLMCTILQHKVQIVYL
jgi:hypothetical protein